MPRNLSVSYPNGETEYWFTERVFAPGDTVELRGSTWEVVAIGGSVDPEGDKHSTMIVREHTDGADTTAPGPAVSGPTGVAQDSQSLELGENVASVVASAPACLRVNEPGLDEADRPGGSDDVAGAIRGPRGDAVSTTFTASFLDLAPVVAVRHE